MCRGHVERLLEGIGDLSGNVSACEGSCHERESTMKTPSKRLKTVVVALLFCCFVLLAVWQVTKKQEVKDERCSGAGPKPVDLCDGFWEKMMKQADN